jgi:hypothetical protein
MARFYSQPSTLDKVTEIENYSQLMDVVCVANWGLVLGDFARPDDPLKFPHPVLQCIESDQKGDVYSALFLSLLLRYLDLPTLAKRTNVELYQAIESEISVSKQVQVHGDAWRPRIAPPGTDQLSPDGARRWLEKKSDFLSGTCSLPAFLSR